MTQLSLPETATRARACQVVCHFSAEQVAERVRELAAQINADYADQHPLLVGVLKGAWMFMADLARQLTIPVCCDFVRVSSYGMGTTTSGEPRLLLDVTEPLSGRHVLLIDDIIDTGISVSWLLARLRDKQPASLRLCTLLDKPSRRRVALRPDYVGFEIPDQFVVGYGIDYAEQFRELPFIGYVTNHD
jgi:hypoxanthine phosphoribosyltransferase